MERKIRGLGVALIVVALGLLYAVIFMWEEENATAVDLPDGNPSILSGGSCPMGYEAPTEEEKEVTCEQLYNREWYESALSCVRERRQNRDNMDLDGIRVDDELERAALLKIESH